MPWGEQMEALMILPLPSVTNNLIKEKDRNIRNINHPHKKSMKEDQEVVWT